MNDDGTDVTLPDGSKGRVVEVKRLDLAEVAEAVGCPTDLILTTVTGGGQVPPGMIAAFYTPDLSDEPTVEEMDDTDVLMSLLARDDDGILRIIRGPISNPGMLREFRKRLEEI